MQNKVWSQYLKVNKIEQNRKISDLIVQDK